MATRRTPQRERSEKIGKQQGDSLFLRIIPSLGEVPIGDSFAEKRFVESGTIDQYCGHLYGQALTVDRLGEVSDEALRARTIEVYRLCYEASNAKREKVLAAFVRHHPGLVCQADWFVKLVRECAQIKPSTENGLRNRTFRAIANGFRGTAGPIPDNTEFLRQDLKWAWRMRISGFSEELAKWYKARDVDVAWATPEGKQNLARAKANEFIKESPRLTAYLDPIAKLLATGRLYRAALLIISIQSGIPQRDLQGKRSR
jgi:hypothetical protein